MSQDTSVRATSAKPSMRWRTVDIIVAAVLAVVCGLLFWLWGQIYRGIGDPVSAFLPGIQGVLGGPWLLAGPLAAIIIRKPGAALFVEMVAATVSALVGTEWGPLTLVSGLVQGLGAEIAFAIFAYRRWSIGTAVLAGAFAGVGAAILDNIIWYIGTDIAFKAIYAVSVITSGALVAGLGGWLLAHALARTGALQRFAISRHR